MTLREIMEYAWLHARIADPHAPACWQCNGRWLIPYRPPTQVDTDDKK
jgi:hypothetical protein